MGLLRSTPFFPPPKFLVQFGETCPSARPNTAKTTQDNSTRLNSTQLASTLCRGRLPTSLPCLPAPAPDELPTKNPQPPIRHVLPHTRGHLLGVALKWPKTTKVSQSGGGGALLRALGAVLGRSGGHLDPLPVLPASGQISVKRSYFFCIKLKL